MKNDFIGHLKEVFALEGQKSARNLYEGAALVGAARLLVETKISDPIEQVKYLYEIHRSNDEMISQWIPWAWFKKCINENKITQLQREDWVNALFISGAYLECGPEGSIRFLESINLPYASA